MGMYICEVSKIRTRPCWPHNHCLLYLLCNNWFVRARYSVRMVMKMTLEEAIKHTKDIAKDVSECTDCRMEHKQLTGWLEEVQQYRDTTLSPEQVRTLQTHFVDASLRLGEYMAIGTPEECLAAVTKARSEHGSRL